MGIGRMAARAMGTFGVALAGEALFAILYPVPKVHEYDASFHTGTPGRPTLRITAIGDSTLTGAALENADDIWIRQLAMRLADRFAVTVTSYAIGGSTAAQMRREQLAAAIAAAADVTFVSVGANDAIKGVPLRAFEKHLDVIVGSLTSTGTLVILSGVGDLGTIPRLLPPLRQLTRRRGRRFDQASARVAERHGAVKVDMWGITAEKFATLPGIFSIDRFHPTRLGHSIWADAAEVTLEPHLHRFV